jgi:hypothetical protein
MPDWGWFAIAFAFNWVGAFLFSWLYIGALALTKQIEFQGWIWWRGWFPVARWLLVAQDNWFARAWAKWYGHALMGNMIHRDEPGERDDDWVEQTIVHELRHNVQQLILGMLQWVFYLMDHVRKTNAGKDGYKDNVFEVDARDAQQRWVARGRPRIFDFGKRR